MASDRILPLEGGCNFRDMGGYQTRDGRRVRHGKLFRSGVLSYFTPADHEMLTKLGIKVICDLRHAHERTQEPVNWPTQVTILTCDQKSSKVESNDYSWMESSSGSHAREVMIKTYRGMPFWLTTRLQHIFNTLAAGDVPLLFNCSAGKDRTGLSAALVLHTLGVPRETILEDYVLTNSAVDLTEFMRSHRKADMGVTDQKHREDKIDPDIMTALLKADPEYLDAAFHAIESEHGSVDTYVRDQLGFSDNSRENLRNQLLSE